MQPAAPGRGILTARCSLGVVITGASKGLGYALAREHLAAGDRLVICARDPSRLSTATEALRREFPGCELHAIPCDVSNGHGMPSML